MYKISWKELLLAYEDCKKHKRSSYYCMLFEMFEYQELHKLFVELNEGTYHIGKSITFVVHYPKDREVFAAAFRDRIVHHLVIMRLKKGIENTLISHTFSCRENKGTLAGIKHLEADIIRASDNYKTPIHILSCDLKNFFMSIDKDVLMEQLDQILVDVCKKDYEFYKHLIELIVYNRPQDNCIRKQSIKHWKNLPPHKSLFHCNGIPIGNLTSQNFANIYLTPADLFVLSYFVFYGRYADDIYTIDTDKNKLREFVSVFDNFLKDRLHISLHPKKISIKTSNDTIRFLGAIMKQNHKTPIRRIMGHLKEHLIRFNEYHDIYEELSKDDQEYMMACVNSYYGLFRQFNTYRLRKKIVKMKEFQLVLHYYNIDSKYTKLIRKS